VTIYGYNIYRKLQLESIKSMKQIITFLAKLGFWPFVLLFTSVTLIISELLVVLHSYWLTGDFFDKNLLIAGFFIPIIDGFIGFGLVAFLIRYLHELDNKLIYEKKTSTSISRYYRDNDCCTGPKW
jgi:hypothetical protein